MRRFSTLLTLTVALAALAPTASAQARLFGTPAPSPKPLEASLGGGIVGDGSFESGTPNVAWDESSTNFGTPLCDQASCGLGGGTGPRTGAWWSWFGGIAANEISVISQSVTIPTAPSATLEFYLEIPLLATPPTGGDLIVTMDGATLATYTYADQAAYATYALVTIPINTYADGAAHVLTFTGTDPAGTTINFFVDDVSITATPAGASIAVTPATINFGGVQVGSSSTAQTVTVTNNGGAPVTIASIMGSGAPFAVSTAGTDLTLDPTQSTTFTVTYSPTAQGASTGTVTITSDAPGAPATVALSGTGTSFLTYSSTDTPLPIPDNDPAGITSTITVPAGAPGIADLDVDLDITHTWVGDLIVTLSNGTTTAELITEPRAAGNCSGNDINLVLSDEGTTGSIQTNCISGANPAQAYTAGGSYTPNSPLSAFDGSSATGTWTLTISDNAGQDTGTLNSWALLVSPTTAGENGAGTAASRLSVAPNPVSGAGQVSLTVGTAQDVRVVLLDALGREVRVLLDRSVTAGQQAHIGFSTAGLPAGVYVVRATGTDVDLTQRVTVVR